MQQLNFNDIILKNFIDQVFNKFDVDKNGKLDPDQMTFFFNDLFKTLNIQNTVTKQQAMAAIRQMDQNGDGYADKQQLFQAFKLLLKPKPPINTLNNSYQSQYYNPYQTQQQIYPPNNGLYNSYSNPYNQYPQQYNPYQQNMNNPNYIPPQHSYSQGQYQSQQYYNNPYNNPYNQGGMGGSLGGPRGSGWGRNR